MLTNDFYCNLNNQNIDRDYVIIRFKKETEELEFFTRGYLLNQTFSNLIESISIDKDKEKKQVLSILVKKDNYDDYLVKKITEIYGEGTECYDIPASEEIKVSLLLRTLNKYDGLNNVSGTLIRPVSNKANNKNQAIFLEIKYYRGIVSLNVATFTKYNEWGKWASKEEIDKTKTFYEITDGIVNVTGSGNPEKYVRATHKFFKKNMIHFFKLNSNDAKSYKKTKIFYLNEFLKDANDKLNGYIKLTHKEKNFIKFKSTKKVIEHDELIEKEIYVIVNKSINNLDKSQMLYEQIKRKFPNVNISIQNNIKDSCLNIIIVDTKETYEERDMMDEHRKSNEQVFQHVYFHNINSEMTKPQLKAILIDPIIKKEVIHKKIGLYEFKTNDYEKWNFIKPHKKEDGTYMYIEMRIKDKELIFNCYESEEFKMNFNTELFILKDGKTITIERTNEFIVPNHYWIDNRYQQLEDSGDILISEVIEASNIFLEKCGEKEYLINRIEWKNYMTRLEQYEYNLISRSDLFEITKELKNDKDYSYKRKGFYGKLVEYIYQSKGILIALNTSNATTKSEYLNGFKSINYSIRRYDTLYYVAPKNMSYTLNNAIVIRKISSTDEVFIKEYLELLNTKSIRQEESSVSVLFLKYLNEYEKNVFEMTN